MGLSVPRRSRHVLVLGTTELAREVVEEMLDQPGSRDLVVGVADDGSAEFKPTQSLGLGPIENLGRIIEGFDPDLIVCATSERYDRVLMSELIRARARGIPVEEGAGAYERLTGKIAIEHAAPRAILFSKRSEASWIASAMARALSFAIALGGLVVFSPLLLLVALLIKLDSEGPVFFLHERVGLRGQPFRLIRFRTRLNNIHRTTRVGHWLRRFHIDELPQFLNILWGHMNLVGPGPHPVAGQDLFTRNIPYYTVRSSVRPGLTGWAQIRYGFANNLEEETERMRYDLYYIRHASLGLDLRILLESLKVVVPGGRKAAPLESHREGRFVPTYFGARPVGNTDGAARV